MWKNQAKMKKGSSRTQAETTYFKMPRHGAKTTSYRYSVTRGNQENL